MMPAKEKAMFKNKQTNLKTSQVTLVLYRKLNYLPMYRKDTHTVKVGEIMINYVEVRTLSNFLYSIQITETE